MIVRKTRYNFAASKSYADCGKRNTKEVFECSDYTDQKSASEKSGREILRELEELFNGNLVRAEEYEQKCAETMKDL